MSFLACRKGNPEEDLTSLLAPCNHPHRRLRSQIPTSTTFDRLPLFIIVSKPIKSHIMALHGSGEHPESPSGPVGNACISGRTLIACQSCASAKTGCDKKVPCSRCIEKNIQCTARYARRASKAAIRAAQAASLSTKDQITGLDFRPQQFQENSLPFSIRNYPGDRAQASLQHLHGGRDHHDENTWDIHHSFSPLSAYSAAGPSPLGSNSSYSDSPNAFEHKQISPIPVGVSKFPTNTDLIHKSVVIRMSNPYQYHPDNDSNTSSSFSKMPSLQGIQNYASYIEIPDASEDAPTFLGGFRNPAGFDIVGAPNEPHLWEKPSLSCAKNWMIKLRQRGLFDSHSLDTAAGESMRPHQQSKAEGHYPSRDRQASLGQNFLPQTLTVYIDWRILGSEWIKS